MKRILLLFPLLILAFSIHVYTQTIPVCPSNKAFTFGEKITYKAKYSLYVDVPVGELKVQIQPNAQEMKLGIYDIAGKEITTFVNTYQEAGKYEYTIDADKYNIGAGVYFLRIVAGSQAIDEKLIRIR